AVSADGSRLAVTGDASNPISSFDYATIGYDASTGQPAWLDRYNGPANANDEAHSVTMSPNGSMVVVTGDSLGSGSAYDYATIAYDTTTGEPLWLERYNGP